MKEKFEKFRSCDQEYSEAESKYRSTKSNSSATPEEIQRLEKEKNEALSNRIKAQKEMTDALIKIRNLQ